MECFKIRNLSFSYPEQEKKAIDSLSLSVEKGEFLVLCGPSGCGKSTLLRQLKTVLAPHGRRSGEIIFEGANLDELDLRSQSAKIGFVQQSPDNQIVTDKVWHELAFGLESLGCPTPEIRRRVAEMAAFFGIEDWFYKNVTELSGGQKQLLNLASVMVMQPSVLILDEPTSQLDPIAASDFLATLGRINRELGTTVILTEHRLEEVFSLASSVAVMDGGVLICRGKSGEVGEFLRKRGHAMFLAMPTAMRVWAAVGKGGDCPVTVREGRSWLAEFARRQSLVPLPPEECRSYQTESVLEAEGLWFRYEKGAADVVRGLDISLKKGEFLALLGGNGSGKTTSLKLLAGLQKPQRGQVCRRGSIGVLPQDPQSLFVKKSLREDLAEVLKGQKSTQSEKESAVARVARLCRLEGLLQRHPYDLSGGEQQRAALAKVLLLAPDILLMDEPTKGLDAEFKELFAEILLSLLHAGVSIFMVSHDVEFCARYAHRCALFFDGSVVTQGSPRSFFSGNSFYTTSANRMARDIITEAVTPEDIILSCGGKMHADAEVEPAEYQPPVFLAEEPKMKKLSLWRKMLAGVSGAVALGIFIFFVSVGDLTALVAAEGLTALSQQQLWLYGAFIAALFVCAFSVGRKKPAPDYLLQTAVERRKLSKRTLAATALILLLIPLTLLVGETYLGGRKYYFISLLIMLEIMLPFFMIFESRKPQARELVVIAVLCAINIAGRTLMFMLPEFKPVWALTIIVGVAFGAETGFLVGAVTMLASNVMFSQGPWTPWQMFAMGIIGFLAGLLFRKGLLRRDRLSLCIFGSISCILVYGLVMNGAAALLSAGELSFVVLLPYLVTGFPVDCVHAAATWLFLWFTAEPMLEKMDRIKVKYGLVE